MLINMWENKISWYVIVKMKKLCQLYNGNKARRGMYYINWALFDSINTEECRLNLNLCLKIMKFNSNSKFLSLFWPLVLRFNFKEIRESKLFNFN